MASKGGETLKLSDLSNLSIEKNCLMQIINNNEYNKLIIDHYSRLAGESPNVDFSSNIENLENCNKFLVMI